jgi:hypothetical protein
MVSKLKGATYKEKLGELDMLTLDERSHFDMVQVYKILLGHDRVIGVSGSNWQLETKRTQDWQQES